MQTMESRWTDDRMDDLGGKVEKIDRDMREEFAAARTEVQTEFRAVRAETQAEFRSIRGEIKMLQATTIGGFVSVLAAIAATQL